jgi:hypothetical protein
MAALSHSLPSSQTGETQEKRTNTVNTEELNKLLKETIKSQEELLKVYRAINASQYRIIRETIGLTEVVEVAGGNHVEGVE